MHTGRQHRHFGHYYKCMIITRKKIKFHVMWSRTMIYNLPSQTLMYAYIHTYMYWVGLGCNCLDTWEICFGLQNTFHMFLNFESHAQYLSWKTMLSSDFHCMKENLGKAKVQLDWVVRSRKKSPKTQSIQRWFCIGKSFTKVTYCWDWNLFKALLFFQKQSLKSVWRAITLEVNHDVPHISQITSL